MDTVVPSPPDAAQVIVQSVEASPGFLGLVHGLAPYMDLIQSVAVTITLGVLIWYTFETRGSRKSGEKSLALLTKQFHNSIAPRLSIVIMNNFDNPEMRYEVIVSNLPGVGTALDVAVGLFTNSDCFYTRDKNCDIVQNSTDRLVATKIPDQDTLLSIINAAYGLKATFWIKSLVEIHDKRWVIVICAKDSEGRNHVAAQSIRITPFEQGKLFRESFD